MPNLSIKNVPEHVVAKLRLRAASHHRSLQGELMELICRVTDDDGGAADKSAKGAEGRERIDRAGDSPGWLSIEELATELGVPQRRSSRNVPLAVDILRQERDSR